MKMRYPSTQARGIQKKAGSNASQEEQPVSFQEIFERTMFHFGTIGFVGYIYVIVEDYVPYLDLRQRAGRIASSVMDLIQK